MKPDLTTPARSRALWWILLAAAGTFALTMGTRQTMGLFLGPLNTSTGLGLSSISLAFAFGQNAGRRFAAAGGSSTHSLPSYHGAYVAIWVGIPALMLVLIWLLFQDSVIDGLRSYASDADGSYGGSA